MALENPLWQYVLRLYSTPGVEEACLTLQAQGAAVNSLLLACWAGQRGIELTTQEWQQLSPLWRTEVLEPLRRVRYRARALCQQKPALDDCYQVLKQAELAAEQAELMQLYAQVSQWNTDPDSPAHMQIHDNLAAYGRHAGIELKTDLLETLVRATLETPEVG